MCYSMLQCITIYVTVCYSVCVTVFVIVCYCVCVTGCVLFVADPVAIVVDVHMEVLVHGGKGGSVSELFGGQSAVHHVVVKSVQQLNVHIAHQSIQDLLQQQQQQQQQYQHMVSSVIVA